MKKIFVSFLSIAVCILLLVGCNNNQDGQVGGSESDPITEVKTDAQTENETDVKSEADSEDTANESATKSEDVSSTECQSESATESANVTETATEIESESESVTESETKPQKNEITATSVQKKGNRYVIVLPISKTSIPVDNSYTKYLHLVTDELVEAAEAKIIEAARELGEDPQWTVGEYGDMKLCLIVEVIKFVEGADYMDEVGCGIDHEHVFLAESIIAE